MVTASTRNLRFHVKAMESIRSPPPSSLRATIFAEQAKLDTVSKLVRSEIMRRVRSKDTRPEMQLRQMIHAMGFRYRLHDKRLPGNPDLVFASRRKVIFVPRCFSLGHRCGAGTLPTSNIDYWKAKRERNRSRDRRNLRAIKRAGWASLVVWECDLRSQHYVRARVVEFLNRKSK